MTDNSQTSLNIFEQASRAKLRFETARGMLYVEDLWEMPLTSTTNRPNLNEIAKELHRKIQNSSDEFSLAGEVSGPDAKIQLQFDVVKHIFAVKQAENKAARTASDNKQREQYLLGLLAKKKGEQDENMSIEDIQQALAAIGG
jgi:hypothetical protein